MSDTETKRRGLSIYTRDEAVAPGMSKDPEYRKRTIAAGVPAEWFEYPGARSYTLFSDRDAPPERRMMLAAVKYGPNYKLPRHSHTVGDCLYYVSEGEIRLGNRVLKAGDGFFVPSSAPYTYECGPEGAEVLEFRVLEPSPEGQPGTIWSESAAGWDDILETARANADQWADAGFGS